jgi:three-Cys-motif partner protein
MVTTDSFFEKQTEVSKVKAEIISKYFRGWAYVMTSQKADKIAYVDLFSGPGRYKDGNLSTPLLVLEKAVDDPKICQKIQFIFNDSNPRNTELLKKEIESFIGVNKLRYIPTLYNWAVDEKTAKAFENISKVPTLSFIDPWGYKGLSLPLIRALVKDWGCDSIFFFNYRRINPAIDNKLLKEPINLLFTKDVLIELQKKVCDKKPNEREKIVLCEIKNVFREWGMKYILPFPFKSESGNRTTHHLIFVSKHILGYNIMKGIMGAASSSEIQGVPSFEYNPAAKQCPTLLDVESPLDDLKEMLLEDFSGSTLTMEDVYSQHHIDKPYFEKNYRKALLDLESDQRIKTNREQRKTRKGSFPKDMLISFP